MKLIILYLSNGERQMIECANEALAVFDDILVSKPRLLLFHTPNGDRFNVLSNHIIGYYEVTNDENLY